MTGELSTQQRILRDELRRYLDDRSGVARLGALEESPSGYDEQAWSDMAAMGLLAMALGEDLGGGGGTLVDAAVVAAELGRLAWPSPWLGTVSSYHVLQSVTDTDRRELLAKVVAGGRPLSLAAGTEPSQRIVVTSHGGRWVIDSTPMVCEWAGAAHRLVVVGVTDRGEDVVAVVGTTGDGVTVERVPSLDNERISRVTLDRVEVEGDTVFEVGGDLARRAVRRTRLLRAALMIGGAREVLDMTTRHVTQRKQFGVPLGSFQAVRHACADMAIELDGAELLIQEALESSGDGHGVDGVAAAAVYMSGRAYVQAVITAAQLHGGVGVSTEHILHQHFRRAKAMQLRCGSQRSQLESVASGLLDHRRPGPLPGTVDRPQPS